MSDKMREEFEQFVIRRDGSIWVTVRGDQRIYNEPIERDFKVWQASRAELVVKLPDDGIDDCQQAWGERCKNTFDCGYNFASLRHEQAIESAGVKVTP